VHWPPIGIERGLVSDGHIRAQVDPSPQLTEHSPVQVMLQVELLPQETVALAPTMKAQVEL
jgi:hypothetical protein